MSSQLVVALMMDDGLKESISVEFCMNEWVTGGSVTVNTASRAELTRNANN